MNSPKDPTEDKASLSSLFVTDEPSDNDHLDYSPYVSALVDQLSAKGTKTPLTLGIFGTWGSGKSTLMRLMKIELAKRRERQEGVDTKILDVNVWQLSSQSELWNAFLQSLFTQVHSKLGFWKRLAFDWALLRDRIDFSELIRQLVTNSYRILVVIIPLILSFIAQGLPAGQIPTTTSKFLIHIFDPITGGIASLVIGYFLILRPIVQAAKEQTSIDLGKILKEPAFEVQVTSLQTLQSKFEKMVRHWIGDKGRLMIFIDDLDRCSPDKITEVLEALKLFATTKGCIYILGVDYQVVARAIQVRYKEFSSTKNIDIPIDGLRYLEKIIQLPFLLPVVELEDINKYLLSFKVNFPHLGILDTISRGMPPNPRMIKRAVNVFLLLWQLSEIRKSQKRIGGAITPLRLAKIVVLQTAFPDVFELFRERPALLKEVETFLQQSPDAQLTTLSNYKEDPVISSLFSNSNIRNLLSMQGDDPLALFADLAPTDLRAFFSLAAQVPQTQQEQPVSPTDKETPKQSLERPQNIQETDNESIEISGNITEKVNVIENRFFGGQQAISIRQIPAPPRDFAGREKELQYAQNSISRGNNLLLITGMGGIGKTAFALFLADLIKVRFPDVQIYINVRGNTGSGMSPTDVMQSIIHALSPDTVIPESENDIHSIYRSFVDRKPGLYVFDDALSEKDIITYLPYNRDSVVIITSRVKLNIEQAVTISLDVFNESEASQLLLSISPRIGDYAQSIASQCGYLPLAIRLAGSFLAERVDLSPKEYLERLKNDAQDLNIDNSFEDKIYASINVSYGFLSADQVEIFKPMSVFEGKFTLDDISGVTGIDKNLISRVIDRLIKYSFLEWDSESSRYFIHPLIRQFVARQMSEEVKLTAHLRHAMYYLNLFANLHEKYIKGGEQILESLRLFDLERENIFAAQQWCSNNMNKGKEIADMCFRFGLAAPYILELRVPAPIRLSWLEASLSASQTYNNVSANAELLLLIGNVYYDMGQMDKATECYKKALEISDLSNDKQTQGSLFTNLGSVYASMGDKDRALNYFQQALSITREIGDKYREGYALSNIGKVLADIQKLEEAKESLTMATKIHEEIGDRRGFGISLFNLGVVYQRVGETTRALDLFQNALTIQHELGDIQNEVFSLINLGDVYITLGDIEVAEEYFLKAYQLAQEIGNMSLAEDIQSRIANLRNNRATTS